MPKTLMWGRSIDVVELTINPANRPLAMQRFWEIRTKSGGATLGTVEWRSAHRAYVFVTSRLTALDAPTLVDIGKFCQNQTDAMMKEKRRAAG
jgi:hypothetical protein